LAELEVDVGAGDQVTNPKAAITVRLRTTIVAQETLADRPGGEEGGNVAVSAVPNASPAGIRISAEPERIDKRRWAIPDVRVEVDVATCEPDGIFTDKPLEAGVVVARPTVTPSASLAGKSTSPPMRVPAMRPSAAEAGCGDSAVGAMSELLGNVVFGGYLSSPPAIGCDPGGATALR
jgi:hypothetical protein